MVRVELPVSRLRARRRRRRIAILILLGVLAVVLLGGTVALSWAPFARVQHVDVRGVSSVNTELVVTAVQNSLKGRQWLVFPKDNIFLYPAGAIRTALMEEFSVFNGVSITAEGFNKLRIDAAERVPKALWCGERGEVPGSCLTLDEVGAAYAVAAEFSGNVYTRYLGALQSGPMPRQFLSPETFRSLSAFVSEFAPKLESSSVYTVAVAEDGEVRLTTTSGFVLIFLLADNGADVLERYDLALTAEPFTTHPLSEFEYLDLRFGDKLYYKMKGAVETSQ